MPRILPVRFDSGVCPAIREAVKTLAAGELVVVPTDTVYGVAADPKVPGAEERIFAAKSRDRGKPIPLLAAGLPEVEKLGAVLGEVERRLAGAFWPGPLTLVLKVGDAEEGLRVPDCPAARALIREAGGVLRVTSANQSGEPAALDARQAAAALAGFVTLVLDAGPAPGGTASSVVRVEAGRVLLLREGALSAADLRRAAGVQVEAARKN